jgi:hypothetical protein
MVGKRFNMAEDYLFTESRRKVDKVSAAIESENSPAVDEIAELKAEVVPSSLTLLSIKVQELEKKLQQAEKEAAELKAMAEKSDEGLDLIYSVVANVRFLAGRGCAHRKSEKWRIKGHAEADFWRWIWKVKGEKE